MWDNLAPRTAQVESVRAALLLVASGETPLGVVYGSDALAGPRVKVLATFPESSHPPIVYPVAKVKASAHPQAAAFVLAADAGGRGDLPRSQIQESTVGWVERSETHRHALERWVSLRSTHPTPYPSYASGVLAPACSTSPPPNSLPSR